ncbi:MAG TPA: DUF2244 domain-containing protein [Methylotenera sp.]|nr:DUF2244 domain-containing protein [Methylotenera sp.]
MINVSTAASSGHYTVIAKPNCSLSPAGTLLAFTIISLVSLLIAFAFLLIGAWPVLPFAGAELLALGYCFYHILLHSSDFERLTIEDDKVIVETHEPSLDKRIELSSYWSKVVLDCMPNGDCNRLALRSKGHEVEFGRLMTSEERLNIGCQLKLRLGGFLK